jgi:SSS family solute:Na+ symporter
MRTLDLIVFILYLGSLVVIGAFFYKKSKSSSAFTVGDHNIPAWAISLSLFATFVSSISYLALPGSAYQSNWNPFVFSLSLPFAAFMAVKYFVPLYRKVNSPSAYTYLEKRFGPWARIYASSMYLLTQVMRIGTILFLMALVPNMMFGWPIVYVIIFTSVVVMIYSILGGIQAVIWTDAVQAIILIGGAIACVIVIVLKMQGGFSEIISVGMAGNKFSLGSFSLNLSEPTFWVVLIYGTFINLQNFGADQNYIQRYMTSKSLGEAQRSAFWGAILYIPVSLIFLFIGTSLYALYHSGTAVLPADLDELLHADRVFPYFIAHELPNGITGLLMASIFAAGMSTISTSYNSSATIILTDYFARNSEIPEKKKMLVLYFSTAIIGLTGMLIAIAMINTKSALDTWWKFASIFSGGVLGLFLLSAFTSIENVIVAIVSVLLGLTVIILMTISGFFPGWSSFWGQFHPYLSIVFGTTAIFMTGFILGSFLRKKHS